MASFNSFYYPQTQNYNSQAFAYAQGGQAMAYAQGNQAYAYASTGIFCQPQPQVQQNSQCDFLSAILGLEMTLACASSSNAFATAGASSNIYSNLNNIVAANEVGTITGDPHFKGGDGGRYDVQSEPGKVYNLLRDTNLNYNGKFEAWGSNGATVVGESAINVCDMSGSNYSSVTFNKDGTAKVNGQELKDGQTVTLADGGTARKEGNKLIVTTAEGYTITQTAMPGGYINSEVRTSSLGVATDNVLPGGLLGQTFDPDDIARNGKKGAGAQGEGAIEGVVQDYETSLNSIGDKKLGPDGQPVQQQDFFSQLLNMMLQMLYPHPNRSYLETLSFVMGGIFMLLSQLGNQRA